MVDSNADATEWTFKLRKGVEFHNGKEMTAERRAVLDESPHRRGLGVERQDARQHDRELGQGEQVRGSRQARQPQRRPGHRARNLPVQDHPRTGGRTSRPPSGPALYKVEEFKPGVRAIGVNFENYWDEGGYLDEIEHFAIGDPVARLNAFSGRRRRCNRRRAAEIHSHRRGRRGQGTSGRSSRASTSTSRWAPRHGAVQRSAPDQGDPVPDGPQANRQGGADGAGLHRQRSADRACLLRPLRRNPPNASSIRTRRRSTSRSPASAARRSRSSRPRSRAVSWISA